MIKRKQMAQDEKKMRFIEPLTDFGFKKLFADPENSDILIDLLNAILDNQGADRIEEIEYLPTEHLGDGEKDRKAVFDLYCRSQAGEYFIVEMQRSYQLNYTGRALFYASYALRDQNVRGDWSFDLKAIIVITLLGHRLQETPGKQPLQSGQYLYSYRLTEDQNSNDKINLERFIFIELQGLKKKLNELSTRLDKWVYIINHISSWLDRPQTYSEDQVFEKFLSCAEITKYNRQERYHYERSLKILRDEYAAQVAQYTLGRAEGLEEGIEKGRKEGIEKGRKEGIEKGRKEGREEGITAGIEKGRKLAQKNMLQRLRQLGHDDEQICQLLNIKNLSELDET